MSSITRQSQKQNRALYTTLAVLVVTATVLSIVTFQADKKDKAAELPDTKVVETVPDKAETQDKMKKAETMAPSTNQQKDTGLFEKMKETENSSDATESKASTDVTEKTATEPMETVATSVEPQALPTFSSPVPNGEILRGHSVTVPVFSPTMDDYRTHTGVDIACATGEAVLSAADGKIGNFWYDPMMGYTLSVVHSGDAVSLYQGLAEDLPEGIEPGATVTAGQTIACAGDTALIECEDEPHIHFMLDIGGSYVDPVEYLEK